MVNRKLTNIYLVVLIVPILLITVAIIATGGLMVWNIPGNNPGQAVELPSPPLKSLAANHNLELGNFAISTYLNDPTYSGILSSQFNLALIDNTPNWHFTDGGMRPDPTSYNFKDMDGVVAYAESHGMRVQAHHLVWGDDKWLPDWLKALAEQIAKELGCDTFVIKPHGHFMGQGVIITSRQDLDKILRYIITKKGPLAKSSDAAFAAWKSNTEDSFIVEEFVTSDPIQLPHMDNRTYQPTMRVAFVLAYNKGRHYVHFLGGYWKTPELSIDEEGDFMHKNKDICEPPYYLAVDNKTMQSVQDTLRVALPRLHRRMLQFQPDAPDEWYAPIKNGGLRMVPQEVA